MQRKQEAGEYKQMSERPQLDVFGTPMPVKTPINFTERQVAQKETTNAAKKKLMTVAFVSVFFITA